MGIRSVKNNLDFEKEPHLIGQTALGLAIRRAGKSEEVGNY